MTTTTTTTAATTLFAAISCERELPSRAANSRVSISGGTARSRKSSSTLWRGHSVDDGDDEYTHRRYLAPSRVLPSFSLVFSHILPVDKTAVYHPLFSPPLGFFTHRFTKRSRFKQCLGYSRTLAHARGTQTPTTLHNPLGRAPCVPRTLSGCLYLPSRIRQPSP